jgi:hypothetical protein
MLLRPRTAILATLAAVLLVAIVILKGSERPDDSPEPAKAPPIERTGPDRPVAARPSDPRKRSEDRRPAPPKPSSAPASRPSAGIAAFVVDAEGRARGGIPVELRSADSLLNPGGLLDAARVSDQNGFVHFPSPKAARDGMILSAGMILEEPLVVPVTEAPSEPVTLRIPESGELEVLVVDVQGRPFDQPVRVLVLVATNDPWPDPAALARATRPCEGGRARIPLVESGTLVLVEGRAADARWRIVPKLIEGPAREGALVTTSLVVTERHATESAPSTRPRFVPPDQGPQAGARQAGPRDGTVRITVRPKDALPQWPLLLQVGLRRAPAGAPDHATRANARGVASLATPPGRFVAVCRLWRVMPDGWITSDAELVVPGQPAIDVAAGRQQSVEIAVDPRALASTAAALAGWHGVR